MPESGTVAVSAGAEPADVTSSPGGATGATGAGPTGEPSAPVAAFDWKTSGADELDVALVAERGWKTPKDVISSYRNLEKLTGVPAEQIIKLPKSADAGEWNQVYDRLGRPKSPADYKITLPDGDPGDLAKVVSPMFHKAGLSQAQVQAFTTEWNTHVNAARKAHETAQQTQADKQMAELKTEWGAGYDTNALLVERAAKSFGMTTEQLVALKTVMGQKGAMKFMHMIGSKIAVEDAGLIGGETPPGFHGMSPATAVGEINRLKTDKAFSQMFNSKDPKVRMDAREKMDRLTKVAYPSG